MGLQTRRSLAAEALPPVAHRRGGDLHAFRQGDQRLALLMTADQFLTKREGKRLRHGLSPDQRSPERL
jgi:hypothetical protein